MNDYNAICHLTLSERQARVCHRTEELRNCYWPDATIKTSWSSGGVATFIGQGESKSQRAEASADEVIINRSCAPVVHRGTNANRAYVELPTTSKHWIEVHGIPAVWTSHMRLIFKCEKRDGVWKILMMTSVFEMDELAPVVPGTDLRIDLSVLKGFRCSYQWLSYVRTAAGGTVNDDEFGIDRPDEVQKLYDEYEQWVSAQ
ncbi:MAG: hypothetical protein HDQ87_03170 [Clostridia bacterium]|nr:hypothetical protein [Clostridia bacterium]